MPEGGFQTFPTGRFSGEDAEMSGPLGTHDFSMGRGKPPGNATQAGTVPGTRLIGSPTGWNRGVLGSALLGYLGFVVNVSVKRGEKGARHVVGPFDLPRLDRLCQLGRQLS